MAILIERAHRALGPKPAENARHRSIVVKFLKYSVKEKIIGAAWRKTITIDGRKVFFDNDYATAVMEKRREYLPIKKLLKEKGIRFLSAHDTDARLPGLHYRHLRER